MSTDSELENQVTVYTEPCDFDPDPIFRFSTDSDDFQKHGYASICRDHHTLVAAQTGCGKTRIATFGAAAHLRKEQTVAYTTPIKTLTNQKYKEACEFADEFERQSGISISVGIMTGDIKINPHADLIVMTTEILRNALLKIGNEGSTRKSTELKESFVDRLGCVIFDEVHYINDRDRGHVWEETICLLPHSVNMVMLSATISKAEEFAAKIAKTKNKPVSLIPATHRVVPLKHYIYSSIDDRIRMVLNKNNRFDSTVVEECWQLYKQEEKLRAKNNKSRINMGLITDMVVYLNKHHLLPAIFFCFSRKSCEKYAAAVSIPLVNHDEVSQIEHIFDTNLSKYREKNRDSRQFQTIRSLLVRGVAFHHSGLIPILKEIVEIVFSRGLVKVLFATETFAVGVNMPTRTVVFTELQKPEADERTGKIIRRFVQPAEYRQMAGRAGRRGIDKTGTVIILPLYSFPPTTKLHNAMLGSPPSITSKLAVTYCFLLKIVMSQSTNLTGFMGNTLLSIEQEQHVQSQNTELATINQQLQDISPDLGDDPHIQEYQSLLDKEDEFACMGVSFTSKQAKQHKKAKRRLELTEGFEDKFQKYREYRNLQKLVTSCQSSIQSMESIVNDNTTRQFQFMKRFGYLSETADPSSTNLSSADVTVKGLLAAQINECNSFIMTELITQRILYNMSPQEVVAVLAIFLDDIGQSRERKLRTDVNVSENVTSVLSTIANIVSEFDTAESDMGIDNPDIGFWNLYYDYVEAAFSWANGHPVGTILGNTEAPEGGDVEDEPSPFLLDTYEGNFIRSMLKIANIAKDMICLCTIYGDLTILPVLEQIEGLVVRDMVSPDSLYTS